MESQLVPVPLYPALQVHENNPGPRLVQVDPIAAQLLVPPPTPVQLFMAGNNETGRDKTRERVSQ